jgi:putative flippase GtrA
MRAPRFVRFLAAGGTAALVNIGARIALDEVMPYVPAIVLAYGLGMATAFALNRRFVFEPSANPLGAQVGWFVAINLAAVAQTLLVSLLLARVAFPWLGMDHHPETVAHVIGVLVPVVTSYLGHARLTFRRH